MTKGPSSSVRAVIWIGVIAVLVLLGVFTLGWVLATRDEPSPTHSTSADYEAFRGPWEALMSKAGVKATFPGGPVDVAKVTSYGRHPISISVTAREAAALIEIYRLSESESAAGMDLADVEISFPRRGVATMSGGVLLEGTRYQARTQAPVSFAKGRIYIDKAQAKLSVEGFSVGGRQRRVALDGLEQYLNELLRAAPGLQVERATVVEGALLIEGVAPDLLEHPRPLPSTSSSAYALR